MNISQRTVSLILSEDGRSTLELAGIAWNSPGLLVEVEDTDDIGIWIRIEREEGEYILLVRWDYVLTVDFPTGEARSVGLKP